MRACVNCAHVSSQREYLARLLISGQVGERLIHLVGDRFVLTALVYHHVCNAKGKVLGGISRTELDAALVLGLSPIFMHFHTFHDFFSIFFIHTRYIYIHTHIYIYIYVEVKKIYIYMEWKFPITNLQYSESERNLGFCVESIWML